MTPLGVKIKVTGWELNVGLWRHGMAYGESEFDIFKAKKRFPDSGKVY